MAQHLGFPSSVQDHLWDCCSADRQLYERARTRVITYMCSISGETHPAFAKCRCAPLMRLVLVKLKQFVPWTWPIWKDMLVVVVNLSSNLVVGHSSFDSECNPPHRRFIENSDDRPVHGIHHPKTLSEQMLVNMESCNVKLTC